MIPVIEFQHAIFNRDGLVDVGGACRLKQVGKMQVKPAFSNGTVNHKKPFPIVGFFWRDSVLQFTDRAAERDSEVVPEQKLAVGG